VVLEEVEVWTGGRVWCRSPSDGEGGVNGLDNDEDMEVIPTEDQYTRLLRS